MLNLTWFIRDVVRDQLIMEIRVAGSTSADDTVVLTADQSRRMNDELTSALDMSDVAQDNSISARTQEILHRYYLQLQHVHTAECAYDEEKQMHRVSFLDRGKEVGRRLYPNMATNSMGLDVAHWVASHIILRGEAGTISEGCANLSVVVEMPSPVAPDRVAVPAAA